MLQQKDTSFEFFSYSGWDSEKCVIYLFWTNLSVAGYGIPAVILIQGLRRNTMEKFTGEDVKQCPCQIKCLENVLSVICSLCYKLPLKLVKEFKIELYNKNTSN
jgi:hypothetical protein